MNERVVEEPKLLKNKDLVECISRYRLQLQLSNEDKKSLRNYALSLEKQKAKNQ